MAPGTRKREKAAPPGTRKRRKTSGREKGKSLCVCVRVRPKNERELGSKDAVSVVDSTTVCFDPKPGYNSNWTPDAARLMQNKRDLTRRKGAAKCKNKVFGFDKVFGPKSSQIDIYNATAKKVVKSVLDGYNATVFAYGATGSGKTYTMVGTETETGVMVRCLNDVFAETQNNSKTRSFKIVISYIEVYNEEIFDLLATREGAGKKLKLLEQKMTIQGVVKKEPKSAEEVLKLLVQGNRLRHQAATDQNDQSSRSHAILQVTVMSKPIGPAANHELLTARLNLVDLAGSERCQKNTGERFVEGANINKSLLQLGNCINALAEGKSNYIPYRNSKLTMFLKNSLGGNCKTVMICNISPSDKSYNEIWHTLNYANRAKNIRVDPKKNKAQITYHYAQYKQMLKQADKRQKKLQEECEEMKRKLSKREAECEEALQQREDFRRSLEENGKHRSLVVKLAETQGDLRRREFEKRELTQKLCAWDRVKKKHTIAPDSPMVVVRQRAALNTKLGEINQLKEKIEKCQTLLTFNMVQKEDKAQEFLDSLSSTEHKEMMKKTFDEWRSDLEKSSQLPRHQKTEALLREYFDRNSQCVSSLTTIFSTLEMFYDALRQAPGNHLTEQLRRDFVRCRDVMDRVHGLPHDPTVQLTPAVQRAATAPRPVPKVGMQLSFTPGASLVSSPCPGMSRRRNPFGTALNTPQLLKKKPGPTDLLAKTPPENKTAPDAKTPPGQNVTLGSPSSQSGDSITLPALKMNNSEEDQPKDMSNWPEDVSTIHPTEPPPPPKPVVDLTGEKPSDLTRSLNLDALEKEHSALNQQMPARRLTRSLSLFPPKTKTAWGVPGDTREPKSTRLGKAVSAPLRVEAFESPLPTPRPPAAEQKEEESVNQDEMNESTAVKDAAAAAAAAACPPLPDPKPHLNRQSGLVDFPRAGGGGILRKPSATLTPRMDIEPAKDKSSGLTGRVERFELNGQARKRRKRLDGSPTATAGGNETWRTQAGGFPRRPHSSLGLRTETCTRTDETWDPNSSFLAKPSHTLTSSQQGYADEPPPPERKKKRRATLFAMSSSSTAPHALPTSNQFRTRNKSLAMHDGRKYRSRTPAKSPDGPLGRVEKGVTFSQPALRRLQPIAQPAVPPPRRRKRQSLWG